MKPQTTTVIPNESVSEGPAPGVACGGSAHCGKDAGTDDRANTEQRNIDRAQAPFQGPTFVAQRGQNVVQVFGAK